jgi:hypothetical protein
MVSVFVVSPDAVRTRRPAGLLLTQPVPAEADTEADARAKSKLGAVIEALRVMGQDVELRVKPRAKTAA